MRYIIFGAYSAVINIGYTFSIKFVYLQIYVTEVVRKSVEF
jgi:hypothetical protein